MNSSLESDILHDINLAEEQCRIQLKQVITRTESNETAFCHGTFDGWSCWNDTPANQVAYAKCPAFITGFDPNRFAQKHCLADGTWFRHPDTNTTWSNYTSCVDVEDLKFRQKIINYYITGYSVSLVALVISMVIFFYFKALRCCRITIHKNLFLSFIINNSFWISWYTTTNKSEMFWANEAGCQIFHVLLQYFLTCNYFWMFCEGLYLHTILVIAFVNETVIMRWLYIIGWLVPAIFTTFYGVIRSYFPAHTELYVNLIFLINIVSVLVTKIRDVNSSDINQTKKAVRATLILIPLLGLHFLMMPFRPDPGAPGEDVYQTVSAIVTSLQLIKPFQGLSVSCLFCFFNGEVITLISRKWNQTRVLNNRSYSMAATTVSVRNDK
uniref:Calcitonin receptor n=1 Tax=Strigamia maritima TaxID=126957 RepID=T1JAY3_STRMM